MNDFETTWKIITGGLSILSKSDKRFAKGFYDLGYSHGRLDMAKNIKVSIDRPPKMA